MKMKSRLSRRLAGAAVLALALGLPLSASAQKAAKARPVNLPSARIVMIDFTNMTFTVEVKGTNLVVFVTSESRFFKDGKYATSRDFNPGDEVRGSIRLTPGNGEHPEVVRLYTGAIRKTAPGAETGKAVKGSSGG